MKGFHQSLHSYCDKWTPATFQWGENSEVDL